MTKRSSGTLTFRSKSRKRRKSGPRRGSMALLRVAWTRCIFDYEIKGSDHDPSIRPIRVLDDGVKTYIVMRTAG